MAELKEAAAKRIKVKLKKSHTHRGVTYDEAAVKAGVEIEITQAQKSALEKTSTV